VTETPESPGVETAVDKQFVAGVQGALDATFNARANGPLDDVEHQLRVELEQAGVAEGLSDDRVRAMAEHIAAGEPVVAEPDEQAP